MGIFSTPGGPPGVREGSSSGRIFRGIDEPSAMVILRKTDAIAEFLPDFCPNRSERDLSVHSGLQPPYSLPQRARDNDRAGTRPRYRGGHARHPRSARHPSGATSISPRTATRLGEREANTTFAAWRPDDTRDIPGSSGRPTPGAGGGYRSTIPEH